MNNRLIPEDHDQVQPPARPLIDLTETQLQGIARKVHCAVSDIQDVYPLSPLQEGLLFHHAMSERDSYILHLLLELRSSADFPLLLEAVQTVINRHDTLRSAFIWRDLPKAVQVVCRRSPPEIGYLTIESDSKINGILGELMEPIGDKWDLSRAPLLKLTLVRSEGETATYALIRVHHLVCDHQSLRLFLEEVSSCTAGAGHKLPKPVPYKTYINHILGSVDNKAIERFFKSKLGDVAEPTAPFGLLNVHGDGSHVAEAHEELAHSISHRIRDMARNLDTTPARLFHAAWALVVAFTSGKDDVVFGTLVLSGGHHSTGSQRMLGLSINTLPLRLKLKGVSAERLVGTTSHELVELQRFEHAPLNLAQRCSGVSTGTPLFTAVINFRHNPQANPGQEVVGVVKVVSKGDGWANYPVVMTVDDTMDRFSLSVQTDSRIDPHKVIGYLRTSLQSLTDALEQSSQVEVLTLPVLPEDEKQTVVDFFNMTRRPCPASCIHELFERQVKEIPNAFAVKDDRQSVTFAELNSRANRLARHLSKRALKPEQLVGLLMEPGVEMVVSILAILKSGSGYLPLDPTYPVERLSYMIRDSAPSILITHQQLKQLTQALLLAEQTIVLDNCFDDIANCDDSNPDIAALGILPESVAYVIYTSGSTGMPKAVINEHRGMVNRIAAQNIFENFSKDDICCQKTSISFVDAVFEILGPLCSGIPIVVFPRETVTDGTEMALRIAKESVTRLITVPSLARAMLDNPALRHNLSRLRSWTLSGEEVRADLLNELHALLPSCEFILQYGSSEVSSDAAIYKCREFNGERVPLGRPLPNVRIYILNELHQPMPVGATGEIFVSGIGVSRGYINMPSLTAERFVADSFGQQSGGRLYKTGDLGRWRPDGLLEYAGRADHQVKIRGIRVETGEIEKLLAKHSEVREAVVAVRDGASRGPLLVAYVIASKKDRLSGEVLRTYLRNLLPATMIPSAFCILERFPLTPNGKVDRRALPDPIRDFQLNRRYEAPRGELEISLCRILQNLLQIEEIGRQDDFFNLGLDSLLVMRFIVLVATELSIQLKVQTVLRFSSLSRLAQQIESLPSRQAHVQDADLETFLI